jgi:hypothetical protein
MTSWETFKQFGSAVLPKTIHLHGVAAAGAMLTCIAVALNLGPFAKAPSTKLTVELARSEAARLAIELDGPSSTPVLDLETHMLSDGLQPAMEVASIPAPTIQPEETSQLTPASVIEVASSTSQSISPKDRGGDMGEKTLSDETGSTDLASRDHPDNTNFDAAKNVTIVGVWAPNPGTCSARDFREGALPAVISNDGAWAGETFCMFSNKKQTETGWNVVAKCSSPKERWTANVRLVLKDNQLTWTSRRGSQVYTRCAPDVLMAAAR